MVELRNQLAANGPSAVQSLMDEMAADDRLAPLRKITLFLEVSVWMERQNTCSLTTNTRH